MDGPMRTNSTHRPHRAYSLSSCVFIVELGEGFTLLDRPAIRAQLRRPARNWVLANQLRADTLLTRVDVAYHSRRS